MMPAIEIFISVRANRLYLGVPRPAGKDRAGGDVGQCDTEAGRPFDQDQAPRLDLPRNSLRGRLVRVCGIQNRTFRCEPAKRSRGKSGKTDVLPHPGWLWKNVRRRQAQLIGRFAPRTRTKRPLKAATAPCAAPRHVPEASPKQRPKPPPPATWQRTVAVCDKRHLATRGGPRHSYR